MSLPNFCTKSTWVKVRGNISVTFLRQNNTISFKFWFLKSPKPQTVALVGHLQIGHMRFCVPEVAIKARISNYMTHVQCDTCFWYTSPLISATKSMYAWSCLRACHKLLNLFTNALIQTDDSSYTVCYDVTFIRWVWKVLISKSGNKKLKHFA